MISVLLISTLYLTPIAVERKKRKGNPTHVSFLSANVTKIGCESLHVKASGSRGCSSPDLLTRGRLAETEKSLHQIAFAANNHAAKALEPFAL